MNGAIGGEGMNASIDHDLNWLHKRIAELEADNRVMREAIITAMKNLGVPYRGTPAPVLVAYRTLDRALAACAEKESEQ